MVLTSLVDKNENKISQLKSNKMPIYEPGLDVLVKKNQDAGRLSFTTDLNRTVADADVVFIASEHQHEGEMDMLILAMFDAAEEIAEYISGYTVIVTKSTVPVGTGKKIFKIIRQKRLI